MVLAYQRYGAGKALAIPVQDSWIWQMDATVPVEDLTHETLWRRLVRWLVDGVPDRVTAGPGPRSCRAGRHDRLTAGVRDGGFLGLNDANVTATVTGPKGDPRDVPMRFVVDRDGEYRATFVRGGGRALRDRRKGHAGRHAGGQPTRHTSAPRPTMASTSTRRCGPRS